MIYDEENDTARQEEFFDFTTEVDRLAKIKTRVIRGHEGCINSARFCCDDSRIVTSSADGTVRIWQSDNGKELVQYDGLHAPGSNISKCDLSYDANRLITCGWDKNVRLTDTETGTFLWTGEHRGIVTDCNFSHDSKLVCSASDLDKAIKLWDSSSGKLIKEITNLHASTITKCMFDIKDVRIISTSMDKTCKFWDLKSGVNTITLAAHESIVSNCASTDNGQLLVTCGWDKLLFLWDITTGMYRSNGPKRLDKEHEGCISAVNFSSDGGLIVSSSYDKNIFVWDTMEQNVKLRLQGHDDWVTDVCFSKSGHWILSASKDETVRLWNIEESDKIPSNTTDTAKKAVGLRVSTCTRCRKPFSVAMLDDSSTPGQTLCVFCRMDSRPTIWSVVNQVLPESTGETDLEGEMEVPVPKNPDNENPEE